MIQAYAMCQGDSGNVIYLFLKCSFIVAIWIGVLQRLNIGVDWIYTSINERIMNLDSKYMVVKTLIFVIFWCIWKHGNALIFDNIPFKI